MREIIFLNELNHNAKTAVGAMAGSGNSKIFTGSAQKLAVERGVETPEKVGSAENTNPAVEHRGSYSTPAIGGGAVAGLIKAGKTAEAEELKRRLHAHKQNIKVNPQHSDSTLTQDVYNIAHQYGTKYVKKR